LKKSPSTSTLPQLLTRHCLFCFVTLLALLPTLLTKYVLYGGFLETGYIPISQWNWGSPWFLALLFSANHGLFSWTPILFFATVGLFLFARKFTSVGLSALCVLLGFYYFMAAYPDWPGISSYGNRFFVSLTVFFVLGLAVLLESAASFFRNRAVGSAGISAVVCVFVLCNLGVIFQWGSRLIPARGPVSWRQVARNQIYAVPRQLSSQLRSYLFRRKETLHQIEERDLEQQHRAPVSP